MPSKYRLVYERQCLIKYSTIKPEESYKPTHSHRRYHGHTILNTFSRKLLVTYTIYIFKLTCQRPVFHPRPTKSLNQLCSFVP